MYTIRRLKNEEINKIMDIWQESTIKAHNFINEDYWIKNYDTVKNVYIPIADTFVYEDNIGIRGFISVISNEFIGALFVSIDSQGIGVGSKLINHALKKYNKLSLAVYKDNIDSVKFYKNKEFKIVKEQINEDTGFIEYIMINE